MSTMAPMEHFFDVPFPCDAGSVLQTPESQRQFGWDYVQWRQVSRRVRVRATRRA